MVNTCSVYGCYDKDNSTKSAVFRLPKDEDLKKRWLQFLNRRDINQNSSYVIICEKHFEEKHLNKENKTRVRLRKTNYPIPTIQPQSIVEKTPSVFPSLSTPRKLPTQRIFRQDELKSKKYLKLSITEFSEVNESLLKYLEDGFKFSKYEEYVYFYRMQAENSPIPKITESIRIDKNLHIQLFYQSCPLPLPSWLRNGAAAN